MMDIKDIIDIIKTSVGSPQRLFLFKQISLFKEKDQGHPENQPCHALHGVGGDIHHRGCKDIKKAFKHRRIR